MAENTNENEILAGEMSNLDMNPAADSAGERTVTLKSSDGQEFVISESAAVLSETIKNLIEDVGDDLTIIPISALDGASLSKIITYLNKHAEFEKQQVGDESKTKKEFEDEFLNVEMEELFDLMTSANYLYVKSLLDSSTRKVANLMKNKSCRWVRKHFKIENDLPEELEQELQDEYPWAWDDIEEDSDEDSDE